MKKLTSNKNFHSLRRLGRAVDVVSSAAVYTLVLCTHFAKQQRPVGQGSDAGRGVWIKRTPVLGPRDQLKGRRGLNEAAYNARQAQG